MGAIINSRIKRVVFAAKDAKAGACGSVIDLSRYPFNHKPIIDSGFMKDECAVLLNEFFKGKRDK
jgi:tRNA(adenine34) deaminase